MKQVMQQVWRTLQASFNAIREGVFFEVSFTHQRT